MRRLCVLLTLAIQQDGLGDNMTIAKMSKISKSLKQKYLLSDRAIRQMSDIRERRKRGEKTLRQRGYYLNGSEIHIMTPEFLGRGAPRLGFKVGREDFDPDQYPLLFNNIVPNGAKFKKKEADSRKAKDPCFEIDLLFNRSISIDVLLANPDKQDAMLEILRDANEQFIAMIEQNCYGRVAVKNDVTHVPLEIAAVSFTHVSSRPRKGEGDSMDGMDPHLHIHTQIFKHGIDANGDIRNIDRDILFAKQHEFSLRVDHYIINRFRNELGIEFDFDLAAPNWYRSCEIAGYMKSGAIEALSTGRTKLLLAQAARGGEMANMDQERRAQEIDNQRSREGKIDLVSAGDLNAKFHHACEKTGVDLIKLGQARDEKSASIRRQREWQAANPTPVELHSDVPSDMLVADDADAESDKAEKKGKGKSSGDQKATPEGLVVKRSRGIYACTVDEALTLAIQDLSTRKLQIRSSDLLQKVMLYGGARFSVDEIQAAIAAQLADKRLVARLVDSGRRDGTNGKIQKAKKARDLVYVAKESVLREERLKRMWTAMRDDRSSGRAFTFGTPAMAREAMACLEAQLSEQYGTRVTLTEGQRQACELVTGKHNMVMVIGDAGTGKSTICELFTLMNERNKLGWRIVTMAPSGGAANSIAEATLSKNPNADLRNGNGPMTTQLAARKLAWWDKNVHAKTLIVIDEMGLIDVCDLEIIMKRAKERGALVVGVGDPKQFKSPTAGDGMAFLNEYEKEICGNKTKSTRLARLSQMSRAKTLKNKADHLGSRDDPRATLLHIVQDERVLPFRDRSKRLSYLAESFAALALHEMPHSYVVVTTNADRIEINERIRSLLGLKGGYVFRSFAADSHTSTARTMLSSYQVGSFIQPINNIRLANIDPKKRGDDKWQQFPKGHTLEIVSLTDNGYVIAKDVATGGQFYFDPLVNGKKVNIGDQRAIEIAPGEILRVCAKTKATIIGPDGLEDFEITTGTRITCAQIEEETGRMQAILKIKGNHTRVWIDLNDPGTSLALGYCQTGHSMQGHTLDKEGKLFLDLSSLDHNSFYTNVTRSSWKDVQYVIDADEPEALRRAMDRIGKSRVTDFASRSNVSVVAARPTVIWPPSLDTKALAKLYNKSMGDMPINCVRDFMLIEEATLAGLTNVQRNEALAERLLAGQKRWGAVMLDGEAEGGLKQLADVVVALRHAGHRILVAHDESNRATKKLVDAAENWARTNPCVDIGKYSAAFAAVKPTLPSAHPAPVATPKLKAVSRIDSDLFDDVQDEQHDDLGDNNSHMPPVRPDAPNPYAD